MDKQKDKSNFKVTDKRLFDEEGEVREHRIKKDNSANKKKEEPKAVPNGDRESHQNHQTQQVEFSSFVLSLATTALVQMGEGPKESNAVTENLDAARQMIDILAMLKEKTTGNLNADESKLITDILYELRMKFVSKNKAIQL